MSGIFSALKAQPDAPVRIEDPNEIRRQYGYWRARILLTSMIGYAMFYFVRLNIAVAQKPMGAALHLDKSKTGLIMSVGGVMYGISKFLNGFLGDRCNPRYFMAIGLVTCGVVNVFFGLSASLPLFCIFWLMNNWAQGMGFPPCARNLGYWFSPSERGTSFGLWNMGHMIGGGCVTVLCTYLIKWYGNWRLCFFVPAAMAGVMTLFILTFLRDSPGSLGLPPVEVFKGEETESEVKEETHSRAGYWRFVVKYVFGNKFMWIISSANFLVYTLRYAVLSWGPTFLQEMKHMSLIDSGWVSFGFDMSGMIGAVVAGWISDRWFDGKAGRVSTLAMLCMTVVTYLFLKTPSRYPILAGTFLFGMGFFVYMPQMLIAAIAMNISTKRAAAAAIGLTGIFGYASTVVSGYGIGAIATHASWSTAFYMLVCCAFGTAVLMATTWNVGTHPQLEMEEPRGFEVQINELPAEESA